MANEFLKVGGKDDKGIARGLKTDEHGQQKIKLVGNQVNLFEGFEMTLQANQSLDLINIKPIDTSKFYFIVRAESGATWSVRTTWFHIDNKGLGRFILQERIEDKSTETTFISDQFHSKSDAWSFTLINESNYERTYSVYVKGVN